MPGPPQCPAPSLQRRLVPESYPGKIIEAALAKSGGTTNTRFMEDNEFDQALVTAAFEQASLTGWNGLSIVEAARSAGLPLDRARARFPGPAAVLMRFGLMADQAALAVPALEPSARERLFDLVMRRFDVLQQHRDGVIALLHDLPRDPGLALLLGGATLRSMGWLLEAAGVSAQGFRGRLRANALVGVWLYTLRAWKNDDSPDLAGTMAALDKALDRAGQASGMLRDRAAPSYDVPPDVLDGVVDVDGPSEPPADDVAAEFNSPPPESPASPV